MLSEKSVTVRLLFWTALAASYLLAVLPQDHVPRLTPFNDKGNHFLAFSVLTVLLLHAYRIKYAKAFLWMFLYGCLIEVSQYFAVNRSSEIMDIVADGIGAMGGIVLYWLWRRVQKR